MKTVIEVTHFVCFDEGELKILADKKGLTVEDLSKRTGLAQATIRGLMDGKISASLNWATRLAAAFDVQLEHLCGDAFDY